MMTMTTLTAATISQQCSLHTTTTHKDPSTIPELIVSKADNSGIDNHSSHPSTILREIPTRISQISSTAAAEDPDDDDDQHQHRPFPSPSITLDESPKNLPQSRPSSSSAFLSMEKSLADITALAAKMKQRWPLPLNSTVPNCAVKDDMQYISQPRPSPYNAVVSDKLLADIDAIAKDRWPLPLNSTNPNCIVNDDTQSLDDSPPPDPSPLLHAPTLLEDEDALLPHFEKLETFHLNLLNNLQNHLDVTAQHSKALCALTKICDVLSVNVTRIERALATLVPAPAPHRSAPALVLHPTAIIEPKIPSTPTPALELNKLPFPLIDTATTYTDPPKPLHGLLLHVHSSQLQHKN